MIILTHNRRRYRFKSEWEDFTASEAAELAAIEYPHGVEVVVDWFLHMGVVRQVWALFTDIPADEVHPTSLVHVFDRYAAPIWADLFREMPVTYEPNGIDAFEFRGKRYLLPNSLPILPAIDMDARRFVEAGNLMAAFVRLKNEGVRQLPYMVAAVVKEDNEEDYNEAAVLLRAQEFSQLPMPIVWEVFFCLQRLLVQQLTDTLEYLQQKKPMEEMGVGMRSGRTSWHSRGLLGVFTRSGRSTFGNSLN